jgi:anti-sigma B factor antagonist
MRIDRRTVGSVTILDMAGKMIIGEGDVLLKEHIDALLHAGRKLIVLHLQNVPYIDSAGLAELVRSAYVVTRQGGRIWLGDPSLRIRDLLSVTKLLTVFELVADQDIEHLADTTPVFVRCPLCGPATSFRVPSPEATLECPGCGATIKLTPWAPHEGERVAFCLQLSIPTYEGECIDFTSQDRDDVRIHARLDLFVSEVIERLWRVLPAPRRVVFRAQYANATDTGLSRILTLCRPVDTNRAAVVLPDISDAARFGFGVDSARIIRDPYTERLWDLVPPHARDHQRGVPIRISRRR